MLLLIKKTVSKTVNHVIQSYCARKRQIQNLNAVVIEFELDLTVLQDSTNTQAGRMEEGYM